MAELTNNDRLSIWRDFMRVNDADVPFTKPELRIAVDLMDAWANANQASLISSLSAATVGDATFDETGGTVDHVWTLASHGLAVGDIVRFTAIGTGAVGYSQDVDYYVVQETANEFTLSSSVGGAVIEGTGDSVGTWTLQVRKAQEFVDGSNAAQKARLFAMVLLRRYNAGV